MSEMLKRKWRKNTGLPTMRLSLSIFLLLAIILAAGCSQSGDFGAFIVSEVSKYGGHPKTNVPTPKLDAHWTVKRDSDGFMLQITGASFERIAAELKQVFGTPKLADDGSGTTTHEPHWLWAASDIGVAIQLIGHKNSTEIICLQGMPWHESTHS